MILVVHAQPEGTRDIADAYTHTRAHTHTHAHANAHTLTYPAYTSRDLALEYISRNDDEIIEAQMSGLSGATTVKRIAPTSQAGMCVLTGVAS